MRTILAKKIRYHAIRGTARRTNLLADVLATGDLQRRAGRDTALLAVFGRVLRISNGLMSLISGLLLDWTGAGTRVTEESIKFFMLKTVLERAPPPEATQL